MTDRWFGRLIDKLEERGMLDDTMVMVTTDHGYFLGERDYMGKNYMHLYNELAHLPFIVHFPGTPAPASMPASSLRQSTSCPRCLRPTAARFPQMCAAPPSCRS